MNENVSKNSKRGFLTKEEELELGRIIQESRKAKEELETNNNLTLSSRHTLERKIREGEDAINKLAVANMSLVYDQARIFHNKFPYGPDVQDLAQEGFTGLVIAIHKYDPSRGNKFSTVAYHWISQAIRRGVNKTGRTVRLPENRINDFAKITKIENSLDNSNKTSAEIDQAIMEGVGLSKIDLINIRAAAKAPVSLNKVVGSDNGGVKEVMDFIEDEHVDADSESHYIRKQMLNTLLKAVSDLEPIKKDVILSMFDISEDFNMTAEEVRNKYNIAHFKFKKIQAEAVRELQKELTNSGYSFADFNKD